MKRYGLYEVVGRLLYDRKVQKASKVRLLTSIMKKVHKEKNAFFTTLILDLNWVNNHTTQELYGYLIPVVDQIDLDSRYEQGQDIGSEDWNDALHTQITKMDPTWLLKILGDQQWLDPAVVSEVLDKMGYREHRTWRNKIGTRTKVK